jgi:hypothetical protein
VQKKFNKVQYSSVIIKKKSLSSLEIQRNSCSLIKSIYETPTANIMMVKDGMGCFYPKIVEGEGREEAR